MSADFWAGYLSGAIGILIGNPLDLLKVHLQAGQSPAPGLLPPSASPSPSSAYSSRLGSLVRGLSLCYPHFNCKRKKSAPPALNEIITPYIHMFAHPCADIYI